jgi:hypothetical protein
MPDSGARVKGVDELRMKHPQPIGDAKKIEPGAVIHMTQYIVSVTERDSARGERHDLKIQ